MKPSRGSADRLVSRGNAVDRVVGVTNRAWYRARAYARPLVRWKVPVKRLEGTSAATGRECTMLVAGWKRTVEYYARRFFAKTSEPALLATAPVLCLPSVLKRWRDEHDLVVARVPRPGAERIFDEFYLHVPEGVDARLEVPANPADLALASTRARRNINRVRDNGLTWSIGTDEAGFHEFYDGMYVPFVRSRYGELAQEVKRASLLRVFRRGFMLWIEKDGSRVAGAVFQPRGPVLEWVVGAPAAGDQPAKIGALSAIYVFGVECAAQHGFRWMDLGFSKSSPRDGVLSHKASWGAHAFCPWKVDHDLLFGWSTLTPEVAHFLQDTPLIIRDGPVLSAVTALTPHDLGRGADPVAVARKIAIPGLDTLYVAASDAENRDAVTLPSGAVARPIPAHSSAEIRRTSRESSRVRASARPPAS